MEDARAEALLEFVVGGVTYTLPADEIEQIAEVYKGEVYPLLEDREPLLGMLNLHGQVVPLVRFPFGDVVKEKNGKFVCIIAKKEDLKFVFPIDYVSQVRAQSKGKPLTVTEVWQKIKNGEKGL
jgi:chemotaxis signal transduction protein